jgi:hypothetical protein
LKAFLLFMALALFIYVDHNHARLLPDEVYCLVGAGRPMSYSVRPTGSQRNVCPGWAWIAIGRTPAKPITCLRHEAVCTARFGMPFAKFSRMVIFTRIGFC